MSLLVSAGTQVVVLREARGSNDAPVHPPGAVGIVVRTPAGTETLYLIRFPDGFESSFTADQFEILKHFKDRLPVNGAGDEFQLEACVVYRCVVGSRAYGLETENSDTDVRGVYLAPADMQWSLFGMPEQFEDAKALLADLTPSCANFPSRRPCRKCRLLWSSNKAMVRRLINHHRNRILFG